MKYIGIVSYNIHCNFTNYGSALQSWALYTAIGKLGYNAKLIDYCPGILKKANVLNPIENMWDTNEEIKKDCEMSLPAIEINYKKFNNFYNTKFKKTKKTYDKNNFNLIKEDEDINKFVCGSDTIFCINEFGFDDGYYANYNIMKNNSFSYAASFGDATFDATSLETLKVLLKNFNSLGIRENLMIPFIQKNVTEKVRRVIDPTLLLEKEDYKILEEERTVEGKYILLYSRRKNDLMTKYAEQMAKEKNCKIVEISLQARNKEIREMAYDAGVGEFLSLIKNAEFVVTNSYHGMIFSVIYEKEFVIFSREQCNNKIEELLESFDLKDRLLITGEETYKKTIDYNQIKQNIKLFKKKSWDFLRENLENHKEG